MLRARNSDRQKIGETDNGGLGAGPMSPVVQAPGGSNGEQICEGHGYDEATCNSIGCCQYDTGNGNCWSAVGEGPCTGYEPPTFETYVRSTGPWAKLNPSRPTPDARAAFAFAVVGTGIFVHGGANPGPTYSLERIEGVCA